MPRKILYSPGYGAGWSTWNSGEVAKYMLEYQPIIEFIEGGGKFQDGECGQWKKEDLIHPLLKQLQAECLEKFGKSYVCVLGARDLAVMEVDGRVRIEEYDGSEGVECEGSYSGWM
jgi:hypothetical protein